MTTPMPRPALRPRRGPARGLLASGLTAVTAAAMLAMAGPTVAADAAGAAPANSGPASTPSSATGTVTAQAARADARRTFGSDAAASGDRAWTLTGDAEGLHVLLARADEDYTWRQVASLADAGVDTDRWIGQGCLTGSGRRLVVAYGPRALPNSERRFARGARIAVVDLDSGQTRVLPVRGTLAYFNPGCGAGETVAITQDAFVDLGRTRVVTVDAATGAVTRTLELEGQVSSAIPDGAGVVAARGTQVLRFDAAGRAVEVARTKGVATRLTSARDGLYFVDAAGAGTAASGVTNVVRRVADGTDTALATGANGRLDLKRVPDGRVALLGEGVSAKATLPAAVVRWAVPAGSTVSSTARTAVTSTLRAADALASAEVRELDEQSGRDAAEPLARAGAPAAGKDDVTITLAVRSTAARVQETLDADALGAATTTDATGGATGSPAAAPGRVSPAATRPAGSASNPVDADRTCAVARNAASGQVYQPTPRQVEWAADLATVGALTLTRPTDWKQTGLSAWSPQGKFPRRALTGGGQVPAAVFKGLLAQESNMWQASGHVLAGESGNPLVGDFYGADLGADPWVVSWDSDCGYGVGQITDGMRLPAFTTGTQVPALPADKQKAVAYDYATNIAASLQILSDKWNQVADAGLSVNDGNPAYVENWFYALWAYNTGFHAKGSDPSGAWGLGWTNNPACSLWDPLRTTFLDPVQYGGSGPSDAAHPQDWPYQEKVLGFAAQSISKPAFTWRQPDGSTKTTSAGAGFRIATWNGGDSLGPVNRTNSKPPRYLFCTAENFCQPNGETPSKGLCYHTDATGVTDFKCWFHASVTWKKDCLASCGQGPTRFDPPYAEPGDGVVPMNCTLAGLPSGARVVDDVPTTYRAYDPTCGHPWTNAGTFALKFPKSSAGTFPSKIDFHQIGSGFGGHFWFAHSRDAGHLQGGLLKVTGTWTFTSAINGWGRVLVHVPDHGADSQQAMYTIALGNGQTRKRMVNQRTQANTWVDLGTMPFAGKPKITLSNSVVATRGAEGKGGVDVAWDAAAIVPLPAAPKEVIAVLGDSYTSGEGAGSYAKATNVDGGTDKDGNTGTRNACHRSAEAWSRKATLAGSSTALGARADALDPAVDFHMIACSGAVTSNLLPTGSSTSWMGQYGELPQLDQGYVSPDTTIVALSIGGNDARFGDVIGVCDNPVHNPLTDCMDATIEGESSPLRTSEPALISGKVRKSIATVIAKIHAMAPKATIVLMGYPVLFDGAHGICTIDVNAAEIDWINTTTSFMDDTMKRVVDDAKAKGIPAVFGDPRPAFHDMGICGSPETINKEVLTRTDGDVTFSLGSGAVSQESFHPNEDGTTNYATAFTAALRSAGK